MKRTMPWVAAVALAVLALPSPGAGPVPESATGNWSIENCDGGPRVLVTSNAALLFEDGDENTAVAVARAEWVGGSIVLKIEREAEELILPPTDDLQQCAAPPIFFSMMFAESVALFRRMDEIVAACGDGKASMQCVALVFALVDVSDDGTFSARGDQPGDPCRQLLRRVLDCRRGIQERVRSRRETLGRLAVCIPARSRGRRQCGQFVRL